MSFNSVLMRLRVSRVAHVSSGRRNPHQAIHTLQAPKEIGRTGCAAALRRMAVVELPSGATGPKKRPPRIGEQEPTNVIAAVDCCKITICGNTQRFTCKHPGCGREYASRDAVRKHCRTRHLPWLRGLSRTSSREVEVLPSHTTGAFVPHRHPCWVEGVCGGWGGGARGRL